MDYSEHSTRPARILLHDPRDGAALHGVHAGRLAECNFLGLPSPDAVLAQYAVFHAALSARVDTVFLGDVLAGDEAYRTEADANPNLMFMRDSALTLPWAPELFIPARLALAGRTNEARLVGRALERLGLRRAFEFSGDEFVEGGDVLPAMHDGKRILL